MKTMKLIMVLALGTLVSACASVDTATRNAGFSATAPEFSAVLPSVRVGAINVTVPDSLKVSEANRYLPGGDIVWRGDPMGDRRQQVKAIFDTALKTGTADMNGAMTVVLAIEVQRFHAPSEKARDTIGGRFCSQFRQ